jgi:hypothetical protein
VLNGRRFPFIAETAMSLVCQPAHHHYPMLIGLADSGQLDIGAIVSRRITRDQVDESLRSLDTFEGFRNVVY